MVRFWLAFIAAIAFCGLLNLAGQFAQLHSGGTLGLHSEGAPGRASATVLSITHGGPADKAGIKTGDVISFEPTIHNIVVANSPLPGDLLTVVDGSRKITLTAVHDTSPVPYGMLTLFSTAKIAFLLIGVLIAWRRSDDSAARALAVFLVCFGAGIDVDTTFIPNDLARFVTVVAVQLLLIVAALALYVFACRFPELAQRGVRGVMRRAIIPFTVASVAFGLGSVFMRFGGGHYPVWIGAGARIGYVAVYLLLVFGALGSLTISYREAMGDARARMRWVMGTFIVGFSGIVVIFVAFIFGRGDEVQLAAATVLAIPFGLAYVILRHRVLDIGFVVNRAVVYTCVSVVVVGTFILFEWLLGHVVETNSRASTILELIAALALGLSVRFIHTRVDRYVDDLFFRDRHLAEAAIRRFAHETGMITDENVLIRRTVEVAERNARLLGAAFYARLKTQYVPLHATFDPIPQELDENDAAILDMRTFHNPVDITRDSRVPGAVVFPMIVRGQLAGFLACGEKTTHEALAPDEHDALRVLARDAGIALDSLRIWRIEQELGYLTADGELPPPLRMRLALLLDREGPAQPAGAAARSIQ